MKAKIGMVVCLIGMIVCIGVIIGIIVINNNSKSNADNVDNVPIGNEVNKYNNKAEENEKGSKLTIKESIFDENGFNEGDKIEYLCKIGDIIKYEGDFYTALEFEVVDIEESSIILKCKDAIIASNYNSANGISAFDDKEEITIKQEYPFTFASATASTSVSYTITFEK